MWNCAIMPHTPCMLWQEDKTHKQISQLDCTSLPWYTFAYLTERISLVLSDALEHLGDNHWFWMSKWTSFVWNFSCKGIQLKKLMLKHHDFSCTYSHAAGYQRDCALEAAAAAATLPAAASSSLRWSSWFKNLFMHWTGSRNESKRQEAKTNLHQMQAQQQFWYDSGSS